jgi:hypothetical protein
MPSHHVIELVLVNEDVHVTNSILVIDHKLQKLFDNKNLSNVQQNQYPPLIQVHVKVL